MKSATKSKRWNRVRKALRTAKGITWDECHKIYVLMDDGQVRRSKKIGYNVLSVAELGEHKSLETLQQWYGNSCFLRFINAVRTVEGDPNDGYADLIPQR